MKKILLALCLLFSQTAYPITVGFDIDSEYVYFGKSPYAPEYFTNYNFSAFIGHEFYWNTQSLLIEGGISWENNEIRPFFRELDYSLYFEALIVSIGKNNRWFGEGIKQNFFFPQNTAISPWEKPLWNISVDVPLMPFLFTAGVLFDTKNLDTFKKPEWYSFYFLAEYSHRNFTISAETDLFFTPYADSELSSKTALQALILFPYEIKLYSNAMLQILPSKKGINSWGTLIGVSKYTLIKDVGLMTIAEFLYTSTHPEYAFYQILEWKTLQSRFGLSGISNTELKVEFTVDFDIGILNINAGYTSGNLLSADKTKYNRFTIGVGYEKN